VSGVSGNRLPCSGSISSGTVGVNARYSTTGVSGTYIAHVGGGGNVPHGGGRRLEAGVLANFGGAGRRKIPLPLPLANAVDSVAGVSGNTGRRNPSSRVSTRRRVTRRDGVLGIFAALLAWVKKQNFVVLFKLFRPHRSVITLFHALNLLTRIATDKASGFL